MPRNRNFEKQAWAPACQTCECPALSPGFVSQNAPGAERQPSRSRVSGRLAEPHGCFEHRPPGPGRATRDRAPGPRPRARAWVSSSAVRLPPGSRRALGLRSRWPRRGPGPLALAAPARHWPLCAKWHLGLPAGRLRPASSTRPGPRRAGAPLCGRGGWEPGTLAEEEQARCYY